MTDLDLDALIYAATEAVIHHDDDICFSLMPQMIHAARRLQELTDCEVCGLNDMTGAHERWCTK